MNKEQLIALGLTEEQADKVVAGFGQMVPKSRLDDKINEAKDLKDQITQRDKDLIDLKKKAEGNEDLQKKFTDLENQYKTDKAKYEANIKETQLTSALKLALTGKVHDAELVIGQLDKEKIELDAGGNVTKGLDEQIKELQTSKSFLFVSEKKDQTFRGFVPSGGNSSDGKPTDIGADFAKMANERTQAPKNDNDPWG